MYWRPLRWYAASSVLFAAGIGCVANWFKNRSFHCAITAPLFLTIALAFALADRSVIQINVGFAWLLLLLGTATAFMLEWRYAKHPKNARGQTE